MNNKLTLLVLALLIFSLGWTASSFTTYLGDLEVEQPLSLADVQNGNAERLSPQDNLTEEQIHVYQDRVVIDLEGASWSRFTNTNSMDPVFDTGANGLEKAVDKPSDLSVGDIISFKHEDADGIMIHRIIETGNDDQGWYAITKGDNNPKADPGLVRFNQVQSVLVGVLY